VLTIDQDRDNPRVFSLFWQGRVLGRIRGGDSLAPLDGGEEGEPDGENDVKKGSTAFYGNFAVICQIPHDRLRMTSPEKQVVKEAGK